MSGLRRALVGLGVIGVLQGVLALTFVLASDHNDSPAVSAGLGLFIGWSFIGTGLFAWWRRPLNRFGALMTAVGMTWLLGAMTQANQPFVYSLGLVLDGVYIAVVTHMLLGYPTGRLPSRGARRAVIVIYLDVFLTSLVAVLMGEQCDCEGTHPANVLAIVHAPGAASAVGTVGQVIGVGLGVWVVVLFLRRWRGATGPERRSLGPILATGAGMIAMIMLAITLDVFGVGGTVGIIVNVAGLATFAAVPYGFLFGLLRSRYSRAGRVSELIERLSGSEDESLRDALADALGDRSLKLVYWVSSSERYVDANGRPVKLPPPGSTRATTVVERDGEPVGAIIHDASLCDEPELVRAAGAAAALALENDRLDAELRARVEELQESRANLITFGMAERRRLERDLHDGAQQRLVALSLQVNLARAQVERDPRAAAELLDRARDELRLALEELRELARGIHPAVLTDRGLDAAIAALAQRSAIPVQVQDMLPDRLPSAVEAAAYFVVAESLTNVAKYAQATHALVRVGRENGHAVVEVSDDGVGGANPAAGTGLRGLVDRLAAVDGRLEVVSPHGAGTIVRARIPCAS
jgi:signal transduction histidine kinase